jgi:hypothetical protein
MAVILTERRDFPYLLEKTGIHVHLDRPQRYCPWFAKRLWQYMIHYKLPVLPWALSFVSDIIWYRPTGDADWQFALLLKSDDNHTAICFVVFLRAVMVPDGIEPEVFWKLGLYATSWATGRLSPDDYVTISISIATVRQGIPRVKNLFFESKQCKTIPVTERGHL